MYLNRQEIFIVITGAIAFCIGTILVIFSSLKAGILGAAIAILLAICYRYPRSSLWLFLIYLPFAGTISYGFGSLYQAVGGYVRYSQDYAIFHLAKDVFYFPALVAIVISSKWLFEFRRVAQPILIAAIILLISCLSTLLFVNLPQHNFLMGIMGLKILLGYIPLMVCGYYLIRDRQDLQFLLRLQTIIILVCCGLCLIQYLLLTTDICAGSRDLVAPASTRVSLQARCFVGGSLLYNPAKKLISLPGTFVAPWQWSWFLISSSFLSFGALLNESKLSWHIINSIAIALTLIATIVSGQTTATILVPIIFLILLIATESHKTKLTLKLGIAGILLLLIANNCGVFGSTLDSIITRWNYTPPQSFIVDQFQWITKDGVALFGHGLGKAASAARKLGKIVLIETFYPRLIYEIGWLGTSIFLTVVSLVTVFGFQAYHSLEKISQKKLALCLWLFILLISYNTYYYPLLVEPVTIYYWFFAGILLKLPKLQ